MPRNGEEFLPNARLALQLVEKWPQQNTLHHQLVLARRPVPPLAGSPGGAAGDDHDALDPHGSHSRGGPE